MSLLLAPLGMLTDPENVRLLGKTGSDQRTVKTTLLTRYGHAADPTIRSARLSSRLANGILASRCIGHGDSRRRRSPHLAREIIIKSLQLANSEGAACRQSGWTFFDVATCN